MIRESADITISGDDKHVIITGNGSLDLTNSRMMKDKLADASKSAEEVTVDLRGAIFIDTAILEYLARARAAMQEGNRPLRVFARENSHPLYVLRTVGFTELMDVVVYPET